MALAPGPAPATRTRAPIARPGFVVAGLLLAILLATLLIVVARPGSELAPASAVLSVLSGSVTVQPPREGSARPATDGEGLSAGMAVRTEPQGGRGLLTFKDGSTLELEPATAIFIDELSIGTRGELMVRLRQDRGTTWAHVQPLLSPNSRFMIATPSGTAVARGTSFEVDVRMSEADKAITEVRVFRGQVDVVAAGMAQPVTAVQMTSVTQGSAPEPARPIEAPPTCVRLTMTSSALMLITDPHGRSSGQTRMSAVSQIPRSTVTGPQSEVQAIDVFSPIPGIWEIGIVPRGDGGAFELSLTTVVGTRRTASRTLSAAIQPGQQLIAHIGIGDDGTVGNIEPLQQASRTRARIAEFPTTTAYLPGAKPLAPAPVEPPLCDR